MGFLRSVWKWFATVWRSIRRGWAKEGFGGCLTNLRNPFDEYLYISHVHLCRRNEDNTGGEGNNWIMDRDYEIRYSRKGQSKEWISLTVPHGMNTDLASVPWFLRWFISVSGRHTEAAIVHDFCYIFSDRSELTRPEADWLFLTGMRAAKVCWLRRMLAYGAVRCFGWTVFYDDRPERRKQNNCDEATPSPAPVPGS